MLTVEVKLNGKVVAFATIRNVTHLRDISDYEVSWGEDAAPEIGVEHTGGNFEIKGHRRRQTAWALVAKVVVGVLDKLGAPK